MRTSVRSASKTPHKEPASGDNAPDPGIAQRLLSLERQSRALDPGTSRRKQARQAVLASTERFLRHVHHRGGFNDVSHGEGMSHVHIGANGISLEDALELFEREVIEPGAAPASGGHCAYIPGGALYHAALGDLLAAISNKYAGIYFSAPGAVRMEHQCIRWIASLVGYREGFGGSLVSGGSIANLTAIAAARDAHKLRGVDYANAVVYLTKQAHHCIDKALRIAGMRETQLRHIAMDSQWRMQVDALETAIAADRAAGLQPWLVIASAGTTDTGAVDPLSGIADVAKSQGCWFHVDAAYGGFFLLTEHGRERLRGIERADSVVLDPHKSLFLPYGIGAVLVRDVNTLIAANVYDAAYMQDAIAAGGELSPADLSPELTKHFRAVRMWLPLITLGTKPFAAALEEKLLLARYFREQVAALGFEVGPEPDLSVVTFRWALAGIPVEEANRANAAILEATRRDGRVFLSSTMLNGLYTIRFVALQYRTHKRTVDMALEMLNDALQQVGG